MHPTAPHFLLYSEAAAAADSQQAAPSRWRFVLRDEAGQTALQAADDEDGATPERLELLAIVRALESLDQPSRVTLVTASRNVRRGLTYGLPLWSENGWQWERFGQMTPVKNGDLWRRIDRALEIHALDCRNGQIEQTDDLAAPPHPADPQPKVVTRRTRRGRNLRIDQNHETNPANSDRLVPTLRVGTHVPPLRGLSAWSRWLISLISALARRTNSWITALRPPRRRAPCPLRPTQSVGRR
jgi:ribonuclease HI